MIWKLRPAPHFLAKTVLVIVAFFHNFNSSLFYLNEGNDLIPVLMCLLVPWLGDAACRPQAPPFLWGCCWRGLGPLSSAAPSFLCFPNLPGSKGPHSSFVLGWPSLNWEVLPCVSLTLFYSHQEDPRLFALQRTREVTGPSLQFIAEDTEVPRGRAAWEHAVWVRTDPRGQVSGPEPFPPCGLSPALSALGLVVCSGEWGAAGYSDVGISLIPSLLRSNGAFNL